jgi:hypothetical protein
MAGSSQTWRTSDSLVPVWHIPLSEISAIRETTRFGLMNEDELRAERHLLDVPSQPGSAHTTWQPLIAVRLEDRAAGSS